VTECDDAPGERVTEGDFIGCADRSDAKVEEDGSCVAVERTALVSEIMWILPDRETPNRRMFVVVENGISNAFNVLGEAKLLNLIAGKKCHQMESFEC
jgi:hypothetical protein